MEFPGEFLFHAWCEKLKKNGRRLFILLAGYAKVSESCLQQKCLGIYNSISQCRAAQMAAEKCSLRGCSEPN